MKSLFPEMEKEIAENRLALRRERIQHARHFLAQNKGYEQQVFKMLSEDGPSVDANMFRKFADSLDLDFRSAIPVMIAAHALWVNRETLAQRVSQPPKRRSLPSLWHLWGSLKAARDSGVAEGV
jgi:hypothetical protein